MRTVRRRTRKDAGLEDPNARVQSYTIALHRCVYVSDQRWQPLGMDPISKSIDLARDLLAPVGQTLSDAWNMAIGDRMGYWRAKNALRYQPLLAQEAGRLGLKLNLAKVPDRFGFAWFEEASKHDEPEIQVLFARLLARAAEENATAEPDRRMIDVLTRLTPADALLFQRLYSDQPFPDTGPYTDTRGLGKTPDQGYPVDWLTSLLAKVHPDFTAVSLDNLVLQGCVGRQSRLAFDRTNNRPPAVSYSNPELQLREEMATTIPRMVKQRDYIDATNLGLALYAAVRE